LFMKSFSLHTSRPPWKRRCYCLNLFHQPSSPHKAWLNAEAQSDGSDLVPWDAGLKKHHSDGVRLPLDHARGGCRAQSQLCSRSCCVMCSYSLLILFCRVIQIVAVK